MVGWIILGIVVLLLLYGISAQRKFIHFDELCQNAMSQIGVQQSSRWDALTQLAKLVKQYSEYEYKTLTGIIAQRSPVGRDSTAAMANEQENRITDALTHIVAVAEQYPSLQSDKLYGELMQSLNGYEENVRKSRMVFNDTVTKYNRMVRQFPSSLIASLMSFEKREYLETNQAKQDMPDLA